jgi:DNA-binding MarR family transcriptional regulator
MIRKSSNQRTAEVTRSSRPQLVDTVIGLVRATADQTHRVDQLAAARFALNSTDARALEVVSRTGPLTAKALARALGMTTGGVTTVIDHLERAGYAHRRDDASDRRRVLIEASDLTHRIEGEMFGELMRDNARLVGSYNERELAVIKDFLERSEVQLAAHIQRMEKGSTRRRQKPANA